MMNEGILGKVCILFGGEQGSFRAVRGNRLLNRRGEFAELRICG
jgi:hypothetical protein